MTEKPIVDSQSVHGHDIEAHKREFQTRTTEYFALAKRISDQLQKQAEALEDAGIVTGDSIHTDARAEITNGGLGNLDVGLLNARVDDAGSRKEVELFEEMSALLKEVTEK